MLVLIDESLPKRLRRLLAGFESFTVQQRGADTDRIDRLYKIHYLQWTGVKALDRVLGAAGLFCLLLLTFFGVRLVFGQST